MRISVVTGDFPQPEGTAAGRALWAWCTGAMALGHEVDVFSWSPDQAPDDLPGWCRWRPYHHHNLMWAHLKSALRPHNEQAHMGWQPAEGAVAVADHIPSFPAVARFAKSVATFHLRALLDARAVGSPTPADIQMARCERRSSHDAKLVVAYSPRVAHSLGGGAEVIPIGLPIPAEVIDPVEAPIAALIGHWAWRPNRFALATVLQAWPEVRQSVPGARLLIAGRAIETVSIGTMAGVEVLGEVASSVDVLSQAAVLAFPCPDSTGPKIKVLDSMASGLAVVTTPAGVEGLFGGAEKHCFVATGDYGAKLASALVDPATRADHARQARMVVEAHHSPAASAAARVAVFARTFGPQ